MKKKDKKELIAAVKKAIEESRPVDYLKNGRPLYYYNRFGDRVR
jgi:hypothetical protein